MGVTNCHRPTDATPSHVNRQLRRILPRHETVNGKGSKQGSKKGYADFVKQQPGRAWQIS